MIEMGLVVAIGLLVTMAKMPWRWRMHMLSNPIFMDVVISILLYALHWGTFSGVMIAAIGTLVCSLTISAGRKAFGYVENGVYVPGHWDVSHHLSKAV